MNCKPGDLAVIVSEDAGYEINIGAFVQVLDEYLCEPGEWRIACDHCELLCLDEEFDRIDTARVGEPIWMEDRYMRPIRDPGEDATDETLLWLPVPGVKEPA